MDEDGMEYEDFDQFFFYDGTRENPLGEHKDEWPCYTAHFYMPDGTIGARTDEEAGRQYFRIGIYAPTQIAAADLALDLSRTGFQLKSQVPAGPVTVQAMMVIPPYQVTQVFILPSPPDLERAGDFLY